MTIKVEATVNGKSVSADVEARTLLVQYLRDHLGLTGTHVGCDTSQCGACVVHVNGQAVKACTIFSGTFRASASCSIVKSASSVMVDLQLVCFL